jgi:hypothetical protein
LVPLFWQADPFGPLQPPVELELDVVDEVDDAVEAPPIPPVPMPPAPPPDDEDDVVEEDEDEAVDACDDDDVDDEEPPLPLPLWELPHPIALAIGVAPRTVRPRRYR